MKASAQRAASRRREDATPVPPRSSASAPSMPVPLHMKDGVDAPMNTGAQQAASRHREDAPRAVRRPDATAVAPAPARRSRPDARRAPAFPPIPPLAARHFTPQPPALPPIPPPTARTFYSTPTGFILAATLWAIAALAVAGAYINQAVQEDIGRGLAAKQSVQDELDRRATEATLLYLIATGRASHRGLVLEPTQRFTEDPERPVPGRGDGELKYSGEAYRGLGRMRFAIQEESGLASVNAPRDPKFHAALQRVGVTRTNLRWIVPRVQDYIDLDDTLTLDGAERHDYRRRQQRPPANWLMMGPGELTRVLGVNETVAPEQWRTLRRLLTTRGSTGYNFNTMHPLVLQALLGVSAEAVSRVLQARETAPIRSLQDVATLTGVFPPVDGDLVRAQPSPFLRLSVWVEGAAMRSVTGISLTPSAQTAPWRKEYRYWDFVDDAAGTPRTPATALFPPT